MQNWIMELALEDLAFLDELSDDLDEILASIAYDDKAEDKKWIKDSQEYLKKTYGARLENISSSPTYDAFSLAVRLVLEAYEKFLYDVVYDWADMEPEQAREDAEEILYEHLRLPDPETLKLERPEDYDFIPEEWIILGYAPCWGDNRPKEVILEELKR